jgi:hypothetical protein
VTLRVCQYRHYLGAWNPSDRVRIAAAAPIEDIRDWRAPEASELAELGANEPLMDGAKLAESSDGVIAALTVPARVRKGVWELEWEDAEAMTPRDEAAFAAYGRRVVGFFRAAGFPFGEASAPTVRLVATHPGVNPSRDDADGGALALVNVGESDCSIATTSAIGAVSLRIPPGEGCLVSSGARAYRVIVPPDAEFGLLLEVAP